MTPTLPPTKNSTNVIVPPLLNWIWNHPSSLPLSLNMFRLWHNKIWIPR